MSYTLTIVDVSKIQQYLFASNRLVHNLGASYLVNQATSQWIIDALDGWQSGQIDTGLANYEIWYSGGGNAVILFDGRARAMEFTKRYTKRLLTSAPGLRVVVHHEDFEWEHSLTEIYTKALQELAQKKAETISAMPLLGLSVTAACQYTGLPAVGKDDEGKLISSEIDAKLRVQDEARKKLEAMFEAFFDEVDFAYDFNLFGERGKASYIAVIHADGNGIGKRKEAICRSSENQKDNRKFIESMRSFSNQLEEAGKKALQETLAALMKWIAKSDERQKRFIAWDQPHAKKRLKFVPLVFGGDDVTFVCDGRLGISLAALYLQAFNKQALKVDGKPLYACAGVAIVKNRYPFARAYDMAEALCQNAKCAVKEWKVNPEDDALALDWHFAVSGAVLTINEIRKREYTVEYGRLYNRPYLIKTPGKNINDWETFRKVVKTFQFSEDWTIRRNKLKGLREQFRLGADATENYRNLFDLPELPEFAGDAGCRRSGWVGKTCVYFDALEVLDIFEDVEEENS